MNKSPASVTLNNYGTMISLNASAGGSQAVDFNAIRRGANIVNNFSTGLMKAFEADAVRPGVNGVVNNAGTIMSVTTTGSSSDGVDAQNNSGVKSPTTAGLIEGGRHGITGGPRRHGAVHDDVTNDAGGDDPGRQRLGHQHRRLQRQRGRDRRQPRHDHRQRHHVGDGADHDGDGVDVDGLVNLTNTGTIQSINAFNGQRSRSAKASGRRRHHHQSGTIRLGRGGQHQGNRPRHHAERQRPRRLRTGSDLRRRDRHQQAGGADQGRLEFAIILVRANASAATKPRSTIRPARRSRAAGRPPPPSRDRRRRRHDHQLWHDRRLEQRQGAHPQPERPPYGQYLGRRGLHPWRHGRRRQAV